MKKKQYAGRYSQIVVLANRPATDGQALTEIYNLIDFAESPTHLRRALDDIPDTRNTLGWFTRTYIAMRLVKLYEAKQDTEWPIQNALTYISKYLDTTMLRILIKNRISTLLRNLPADSPVRARNLLVYHRI